MVSTRSPWEMASSKKTNSYLPALLVCTASIFLFAYPEFFLSFLIIPLHSILSPPPLILQTVPNQQEFLVPVVIILRALRDTNDHEIYERVLQGQRDNTFLAAHIEVSVSGRRTLWSSVFVLVCRVGCLRTWYLTLVIVASSAIIAHMPAHP